MNTNIGIGEKIKHLRQQRGITQEQLADYLNLSFQSVSKWERGEAYPDITMLPKIAVFFNTTADELLCIDKARVEEEVAVYLKRRQEADAIGETQKSVEIMREANAKYPGNFTLMQKLMESLFFHYAREIAENEAVQREITEIGEKYAPSVRTTLSGATFYKYCAIRTRVQARRKKPRSLRMIIYRVSDYPKT